MLNVKYFFENGKILNQIGLFVACILIIPHFSLQTITDFIFQIKYFLESEKIIN